MYLDIFIYFYIKENLRTRSKDPDSNARLTDIEITRLCNVNVR